MISLTINSEDVEREVHKTWLEAVSFAEDVLVTATSGDLTLGAVEPIRQQPMQRQGYGKKKPVLLLANNTHYLDFTKINSPHRIFDPCDSFFWIILKIGRCTPILQKFYSSVFSIESWSDYLTASAIDMSIFQYQCAITPQLKAGKRELDSEVISLPKTNVHDG